MKSTRKTQTLLAGIALLLLSQCAFAADATGSFSRNLTVSGSPNIEVQTGSGNITVRTGAGDRVNIEARIRANDNNNGWGWFGGGDSKLTPEERVKRIEANPPVQQNGNTIVIGKIEDEQLRNNVSISYEITVPTSTRLESRTGSGSQRIQDI